MTTYRTQLTASASRRTLDAATTTDAAQAKPAKTVGEDMPARRVFDSTDDATAYLNLCLETYSDFGEIPIAAPGMDDEGNLDPAIYSEGMVPMVATLKKQKEGVKAIIVAPIPTLDALLADEPGRQWVEKIIQKELNHVAARALRTVEDISTVIDQMPTTRDAYISSAREAGGIMETFDELYKLINKALSDKFQAWARVRFIKPELKKAMESAGYAAEFYPALEERVSKKTGEKESLFVVALGLGVKAAVNKGLDPAIFQRWIDGRDAKAFTPVEASEEDEEDFDLDSLADSMTAEPAQAETPAE